MAPNERFFRTRELKSETGRRPCPLIRHHRLDYCSLKASARLRARKQGCAGLPAAGVFRGFFPNLVCAFYEAVDGASDLKHQIMVSIQIAGHRSGRRENFHRAREGTKTFTFLFPESFRLILKAYFAAYPFSCPKGYRQYRR